MKNIFILFALTATLTLSACGNKGALGEYLFGISSGKSLSNEQGYAVSDCRGNFIGATSAREFWKENNLPRGTTNYVCKDYKAYLPNKVTDCQGNNVIQKYGSISNFATKYNLQALSDNYSFVCKNNQVTIIDLS